MTQRKTPTIQIGNLKVGTGHPVILQSMTSTDTSDVEATVAEILELNEAGADIIRIAIPDVAAAKVVPEIVKKVRKKSNVPIVGDFHFNGNVLLQKYPACAKALDKYRINPGTASDENFAEMLAIAKKLKKPVRIGVNAGSVAPEIIEKYNIDLESAVLETIKESLKSAKELGFPLDQIVLSAKMSDVSSTISVYQKLAKKYNNVLHLGLTEAGSGRMAEVASSVAMGTLLSQGIGETFRISLTPEQGSRTHEVEIGKHVLQSLGIKHYKPRIISCPGCGRTQGPFFQKMVAEINQRLDKAWPEWKVKYPAAANLKIAIMGCVVNGPGEARDADIGISLPGKSEGYAMVFEKGNGVKELKGEGIVDEFWEMVCAKVEG